MYDFFTKLNVSIFKELWEDVVTVKLPIIYYLYKKYTQI